MTLKYTGHTVLGPTFSLNCSMPLRHIADVLEDKVWGTENDLHKDK